MVAPRALVHKRGRDLTPWSVRLPHVHWFRWAGDDPLGTAGRYACRCGEVRSGL